MKKKNKKGVIVRFEILDVNDNVTNIISEQAFPNAVFNSWREPLNPRFTKYGCFDRDVNEYVYKQHQINDLKFNFSFIFVSSFSSSPLFRFNFFILSKASFLS